MHSRTENAATLTDGFCLLQRVPRLLWTFVEASSSLCGDSPVLQRLDAICRWSRVTRDAPGHWNRGAQALLFLRKVVESEASGPGQP